MATHSSTLAWRIPWTEEPGRLQSMGYQRVGHNWNAWARTCRVLLQRMYVNSEQTFCASENVFTEIYAIKSELILGIQTLQCFCELWVWQRLWVLLDIFIAVHFLKKKNTVYTLRDRSDHLLADCWIKLVFISFGLWRNLSWIYLERVISLKFIKIR